MSQPPVPTTCVYRSQPRWCAGGRLLAAYVPHRPTLGSYIALTDQDRGSPTYGEIVMIVRPRSAYASRNVWWVDDHREAIELAQQLLERVAYNETTTTADYYLEPVTHRKASLI